MFALDYLAELALLSVSRQQREALSLLHGVPAMLDASNPASLDDAALFRYYNAAKSAQISFAEKIRASRSVVPGERFSDICFRLGASHVLVRQYAEAVKILDGIVAEIRKRGLGMA